FLVFSKDDTGKYGLNVQEAKILEKEIKRQNLNAIVKTGADEIPLGLMLKAVVQDMPLRIKILYEFENSVNKISKYEDIPVNTCVQAQISLGVKNAVIVDENPDFILYINNFENIQGDCVFQDVINDYSGVLPDFDTPYIIADINNANGADNILAEKISDKKIDENFLGYSAYNTSANSIGSALALGICTYLAKKENLFNKKAFLNLITIRFLDDWGYQANIRKNLKKCGFSGFKPYEEKIKNFTGLNFEVKYSLPWNRTFEIEIELE
ncbi:MAG: DUF4127 family protein, partial [Candidatus Gastranaerophilales bacterium]|nr:DUF4127 family protein [Candidatus Gastranaerophilales bacterium]